MMSNPDHTSSSQNYVPTPGSMMAMALHYQSQGLGIFPLVPGTKIPFLAGSKGHRLMLDAKARLLMPDEIIRFWLEHPEANTGMFAGQASGISVIDIDTNEKNKAKHPDWISGYETLESRGLSFLLGVGLAVTTPSGGKHLYFKYTDRLPHGKRNDLGLEVFSSTRNYILLPPSHIGLRGKPLIEYKFDSLQAQNFRLDGLPEFPVEVDYFINMLRIKARKLSKSNKGHSPPSAYSGVPSGHTRSGAVKSVYTKRKEVNGNVLYGQEFPERVQVAARMRREAKVRLQHQIENTGIYDIRDRWAAELAELETSYDASQQPEDWDILQEAKIHVEQQVQHVVGYIKNKRYLRLSSKSKPERWAARYGDYFYELDPHGRYFPTDEELARVKQGHYLLPLSDGTVVAKWNMKKSSEADPKWYFLRLEHPIEIQDII